MNTRTLRSGQMSRQRHQAMSTERLTTRSASKRGSTRNNMERDRMMEIDEEAVGLIVKAVIEQDSSSEAIGAVEQLIGVEQAQHDRPFRVPSNAWYDFTTKIREGEGHSVPIDVSRITQRSPARANTVGYAQFNLLRGIGALPDAQTHRYLRVARSTHDYSEAESMEGLFEAIQRQVEAHPRIASSTRRELQLMCVGLALLNDTPWKQLRGILEVLRPARQQAAEAVYEAEAIARDDAEAKYVTWGKEANGGVVIDAVPEVVTNGVAALLKAIVTALEITLNAAYATLEAPKVFQTFAWEKSGGNSAQTWLHTVGSGWPVAVRLVVYAPMEIDCYRLLRGKIEGEPDGPEESTIQGDLDRPRGAGALDPEGEEGEEQANAARRQQSHQKGSPKKRLTKTILEIPSSELYCFQNVSVAEYQQHQRTPRRFAWWLAISSTSAFKERREMVRLIPAVAPNEERIFEASKESTTTSKPRATPRRSAEGVTEVKGNHVELDDDDDDEVSEDDHVELPGVARVMKTTKEVASTRRLLMGILVGTSTLVRAQNRHPSPSSFAEVTLLYPIHRVEQLPFNEADKWKNVDVTVEDMTTDKAGSLVLYHESTFDEQQSAWVQASGVAGRTMEHRLTVEAKVVCAHLQAARLKLVTRAAAQEGLLPMVVAAGIAEAYGNGGGDDNAGEGGGVGQRQPQAPTANKSPFVVITEAKNLTGLEGEDAEKNVIQAAAAQIFSQPVVHFLVNERPLPTNGTNTAVEWEEHNFASSPHEARSTSILNREGEDSRLLSIEQELLLPVVPMDERKSLPTAPTEIRFHEVYMILLVW